MKTHKRSKESRMHGHGMGTHGTGARKRNRGTGHRGGKGMSGSGKRADHKKTLVTKLYGHDYFGKGGITSRGTKRDTRQRINLAQIELNLEKYGKKVGDKWEINLEKYKILGTGEVKNKLIIKCLEASKSAMEKVAKVGGEIITKEKKKIETPLVESPKAIARKEKKN
ncbi:MAG: uL15 family ribosomal protein [Candidatus Pacearchaeota archaeon]|nr:uL15 family ribosomal protein [Candidatus Pacearchaeota archaeon]